MRNLLLLLFVTSLFQVGAQIKKVDESEKSVLIGKAGSAFSTIASMYKIEGEPDYYYITFSNLKYQTLTDIKSFGFKDVEGEYDYLYSSVATAAKEKKKEVEFKLEDGILIVKIVKAVGACAPPSSVWRAYRAKPDSTAPAVETTKTRSAPW